MAVWNKAQQVDPAVIARIQAEINADPMVQRFLAGYGAEGDPWERGQGGKVRNPNQLSEYIRAKYQLPDGYNVSQDGNVVYGNETPWLRQAAMAAAPIVGVTALGKAFGGGADAPAVAATGAQGANAGGLGNWLDTMQPVGNSMQGGLPIPPGAWAPALPAGGQKLGGLAPNPVGAGASVGQKLLDTLTSPAGIGSLASIIPALMAANAMKSNGQQGSAGLDNANRMAAITEARMRRVDPLHQAVTQLAFGRLPVSSRQGVNLANVPLSD